MFSKQAYFYLCLAAAPKLSLNSNSMILESMDPGFQSNLAVHKCKRSESSDQNAYATALNI